MSLDRIRAKQGIQKVAAERYAEALRAAGGVQSILKYRKLSQDIERQVETNRNMAKKLGMPIVTQSLEYQLLDIEHLYAEANRTHSEIHDFGAEVAGVAKGTYHRAKIKSRARAMFKTKIKYGGDVSRLMDIQRCTVEFPNIQSLYEGVKILYEKGYFDLNRVSARIISFEDRFQPGQQLTNGYCDIQLLLMTNEHVSEMQMNVTPMLKAKHEGGHSAYRLEREENEQLLMACIKNQFEPKETTQETKASMSSIVDELWAASEKGDTVKCRKIQKLLRDSVESFLNKEESSASDTSDFEDANNLAVAGVKLLLEKRGADPNAVRDKTGRVGLHYAARHGNIDMIRCLLKHGANAFALDKSNATPLHRAMMHRHCEAAYVLLESMVAAVRKEKKQRDGRMLSSPKAKREKKKSLSGDGADGLSKTASKTDDGDASETPSMSLEDEEYERAYEAKKHLIEFLLDGGEIGRIASLGSPARSRIRYLAKWFKERRGYFDESECHKFYGKTKEMIQEVIAYIPESLSTRKYELQITVWDVLGTMPSAVRNDIAQNPSGNYLVRVSIPGCAPQTTDVDWKNRSKRAVFNWRLKFRVELFSRSLNWGSDGKCPLRIELLDRVSRDVVVAESALNIRPLLLEAYLCPVDPQPTLGMYDGILGDYDIPRWVPLAYRNESDQMASYRGGRVRKKTSFDDLLVPKEMGHQDMCPIVFDKTCYVRFGAKLVPDLDEGAIRIGASHQGFGRSNPNDSPHLPTPARIRERVPQKDCVSKSRERRSSLVTTPFFAECRVDANLDRPQERVVDPSDKFELAGSDQMATELRLVIWRIRGLDALVARTKGAETAPPIFVAAHIGQGPLQKTDICWTTKDPGIAEFNWRCLFKISTTGDVDDFEVQSRLTIDVVPVTNAQDKFSTEMRYWALALQPAGIIKSMKEAANITCPILAQVKSIGSCTLDLRKHIAKMQHRFASRSDTSSISPVEIFCDEVQPELGEPTNARWSAFVP
eukprot:g2233.t1